MKDPNQKIYDLQTIQKQFPVNVVEKEVVRLLAAVRKHHEECKLHIHF